MSEALQREGYSERRATMALIRPGSRPNIAAMAAAKTRA